MKTQTNLRRPWSAPRRRALRRCALTLCALWIAGSGSAAQAGNAWVYGAGASWRTGVRSMKELRFRGVIAQQYDFSCGAAAVATLLTFHLAAPTPETDVFANMWVNGDRERIQKVGFSLLDMKRYLRARGYEADGYRVPLAKLQEARIPAIALITLNGYKHFVVIKGVSDDEVFMADPAVGLRSMPREDFEGMSDAILLVVRSHLELSQKSFKSDGDWRIRPRANLGVALEARELSAYTALLPAINEF